MRSLEPSGPLTPSTRMSSARRPQASAKPAAPPEQTAAAGFAGWRFVPLFPKMVGDCGRPKLLRQPDVEVDVADRLGRGAGRSGGPPAARCGPPGRSSPDVGTGAVGATLGSARRRRRGGCLQPGPGTAAAGPDLEPDPPPPTRAATGGPPGPVRRPGRRLPREPVAATARRPGGPLGAEDLDGARETPGGCSPSPTPSTQLEQLHRNPCSPGATSNGVSKARAATLPSSSATRKTLPRTKLLQQLKKHYLGRAAFRVEEGEARAWSPAETMSAKLADRPDGGSRSSGGGSRCGSTSGVVASSAAISLPRVNRRRGPLGALRLEAVSPLHRRRLHPDAPRVGRRCI